MASEQLKHKVRAELPTIISRWLRRPNESPQSLHDRYGEKWRAQLSHYVRIDPDKLPKLPSRRQSPRADFVVDFDDIQIATCPRIKQRIISHRDALRFLLSTMAGENLDELAQAELPAIISHWLQEPQEPPLILPKRFGNKWRAQLSDYVGIDLDKLPKLASRRRSAVPKFAIDFGSVPFPPPKQPSFTFIDLFAGIGGFRIALQNLRGRCVFSSEWDRHSKETYYNNFGEIPFGDIRQFTGKFVSDAQLKRMIPKHNILTAGFPCQPFSRAGVSARNALGQRHGFQCPTQGTLFFDLMRIAKVQRPDALFLENVKNLRTHDEGNTFRTIEKEIRKLEYSFSPDVIDASYRVPQRRKRCYIVCLRGKEFAFPMFMVMTRVLGSVLEENPAARYTLSERMWLGHVKRTRRNLARGVGFTAHPADLNKPANTLVARYYKDGKECLIPQDNGTPRRLTPRECARLQGYPENFIPHRWDMQAYRQFGNSVAVPVVQDIAEAITDHLGYLSN